MVGSLSGGELNKALACPQLADCIDLGDCPPRAVTMRVRAELDPGFRTIG